MFICFSCNCDNCSKNLGFKVDYHLFENINIDGKSYCDLVNGAMNKDKRCILELSKLHPSDFASYQHGAVLIEVINVTTESEYLKIIDHLDSKSKIAIYYTLWAGCEFTKNPKFAKKSVEEVFAEVAQQCRDSL
jgi:hypothetical protein